MNMISFSTVFLALFPTQIIQIKQIGKKYYFQHYQMAHAIAQSLTNVKGVLCL